MSADSNKTGSPAPTGPPAFDSKGLRWPVFGPALLIFFIAAVFGLANNEGLTKYSKAFFDWSLESFGWLYQWTAVFGLVLVVAITCSKLGNIRLGGPNAKPKFSMAAWFAMALTGGIAVGIVTWSVNEPIIYYGNVWGELNDLGLDPLTPAAAQFAMARVFHNWTFVPYAMYAICGVLVAYLYYNKKEKLTVAATLKPLFGERVTRGPVAAFIDTLSMIAIGLGMTGGLTMCITLVMTGLKSYGIQETTTLFVVIGILIIASFTLSSYVGLDRGLKKVGTINAWFYYGLIALILITGPLLYILRNSTAGLAVYLDNFWLWNFDPIDIGGSALTKWWTLFDWAFWVAYAPVTAILLAMISYGRTVREFMLVNWILPSVFGLVWFGVWGNTALQMQMDGQVDLIKAINDGGAVAALWEFLHNMPLGLGVIIVPINIFVVIISFVTAADATLTNIGSMCIKDVPIGTEPPARLKLVWGVVIGAIATVMAAFGGGSQGVDGVKQLCVAGGFFVLFIYTLQLVSAAKVFFYDKIVEG
ncbi:MAG: BCCT family transporter [Deltaproteobacteria bacterium]|jgi:choline-glycine betaine transporter|nr:BCCT family transporter [Deltaproteobacteria bacterium]